MLVRDLAQLLATRFLHPYFVIFHGLTAVLIKNVADQQAKCTFDLGLVLKRDRHDETKGSLPVALTNYLLDNPKATSFISLVFLDIPIDQFINTI